MIAYQCDQCGPEWWELRKGVPTASGFDRIATSKGLPSKGRTKYIAELIADLACLCPPYFTGQNRPVTRAMTNGTDTEPEARRYYEMEHGVDVVRVGFITNDSGTFGCSPDSLVGDDGGLELKCPQLKTQAEYLMRGVVPREYVAQVHGSLIVSGRKWWDFFSYAPGLDPLPIRVTWNEYTDKLKQAMDEFSIAYRQAVKQVGIEDRREEIILGGKIVAWKVIEDGVVSLRKA